MNTESFSGTNAASWTPTIGHRRRPRPPRTAPPPGDLTLAPPPELARAVTQNMLLRLMPAVMVIAVVGANV